MNLTVLLALSIFILIICLALSYSYIFQNSRWVEISWKKRNKWYMNPFGLIKTKKGFKFSFYLFGIVCFFLVIALINIIYIISKFWFYV